LTDNVIAMFRLNASLGYSRLDGDSESLLGRRRTTVKYYVLPMKLLKTWGWSKERIRHR